MNENLKKEITIRVASEVKQVIDMFSQRSISMIPYEVINFFKKRGTEEENYPVDKNIPLDKQNLDSLTYDCVLMLLEYVKPLIEYKELEPNWKSFSNPYDSIKQYELEIATNLFNIRNVISQRHLAKIEYVYDFEAYSANLTEEEFRKFQPYIALCRIFCVIHNKYEKENNYTEAVKILYFIEQELKSNFKNEY